MILSALLLATTIQASPSPTEVAPPARTERAMRQPARCGPMASTPVLNIAAPGARPLGQDARAHGQYAVNRMVDGCPMATPMRLAKPPR